MKKIFYFSAGWCAPCRSFGPTMDQIGKVIPVIKYDIDYEADVQKRFNVQSIPTVILVVNDQEVRRFVGARTYEQVLEFIK